MYNIMDIDRTERFLGRDEENSSVIICNKRFWEENYSWDTDFRTI
jgi:hypothetical protein